jgi:5'-nucleotidase / UDP-sugar diphosphatase
MRKLGLILFLVAAPALARTRIVLLQFSDYHSHALPFYSEGVANQGGIARAIGYLKGAHRRGALVFSGGDMVNQGSPAWSDKYRCTEWSWLNGIVDAMALGNHDPDYGADELTACRDQLDYPILSANTHDYTASAIFDVKRLRIGVFALAGSDFTTLVRTPGLTFGDRITAARQVVHDLRDREHVDAVVLIGHESTEDDEALARAVPGIDLIFGSHSHRKAELHRIEGTKTWSISPSQYLTYISRVELTFDRHKLAGVTGGLVRVDASMPVDHGIEARVAAMERDLENDPQYAPLFRTVTTLREAVSVDELARRVVDTMRRSTSADFALSTASSFRQPLPPGQITVEDLRASMPYDNEIVVATMRGDDVKRLIALSESRRGTDNFAFVAGPNAIDDGREYRVATTDFLARLAAGYRDFFKSAQPTGLHVREEFRKTLSTPVVQQ